MTPREYGEALGEIGPALLRVLSGFEQALRYLHPPNLPRVREAMTPMADSFAGARGGFDEIEPPEEIADLHAQLARAVGFAGEAVREFLDDRPGPEATMRVLGSMRLYARAQEALYPLRVALPPFGRFFTEPSLHEHMDEMEPDPPEGVSVGLHASNASGEERERGGFCLYVPERYDGREAWPLVVALHGGGGSGREFLWTWLREARSRKVLLLAPSALGTTWSFNGPDVDAASLRKMVEYASSRWRVDPTKVLLTGLSDGATYSLCCGLQEDAPYTALAPVSGVMHPANLSNGNLPRAAGRPVYLVHGALDWMFPVEIARLTRDELSKAGAQVVYREIDDLSHTYPREENAHILDWFLEGTTP